MLLKATSVFPIKENQYLYINLESKNEVDFNDMKLGILNINDIKIQVCYVGITNIKGTPVVVVKVDDPKYRSVEEIGNVEGEKIYLEF